MLKRAFLVAGLSVLCLAVTTTAAVGAPMLTPIEELGKAIFFDQNLSVNGNQSCASCHAPEAGWTGPDSWVNEGPVVYEGSVPAAFGNRKPPSSAYATFAPILYVDKTGMFTGGNFWDGRATGEKLGNPAADQSQGPFLNPMEQALPGAADVVYRVATATGYPVSFEDVWGWDPSIGMGDFGKVAEAYDQIALSIAAYEASFESNAFTSKFDAWRSGGAKFTSQEARGFGVFVGKGKCGKCHSATGPNPLFTDFTYDNLGIPSNPDLAFFYDPANADWVDQGLGGFLETRPDYASYAEENMGKHKVPTLRNVDKRPDPGFVKAYGHNGYFKSLEEIVHFYNTRDVEGEGWEGEPWPGPEVAANVNTAELGNLKLSTTEEAALVAFMKTLSDGWVAP